MAAINLADKRTWRCWLWAPVVPTLVVTVCVLLLGSLGAGLMQALGIADAVSGIEFLVSAFALNFIFCYVAGLVVILVIGMLFRNLLPDRIPEIPLVSWLNSSRKGRIVLIFATFIVFGTLGVGGMLGLFGLMCLFEFSSDYDAAFGVERRKSRRESAFY